MAFIFKVDTRVDLALVSQVRILIHCWASTLNDRLSQGESHVVEAGGDEPNFMHPRSSLDSFPLINRLSKKYVLLVTSEIYLVSPYRTTDAL
jgi:hypothetical protein